MRPCPAATCRRRISRDSWPRPGASHPWLPEPLLRRWARAYGTRLAAIAGRRQPARGSRARSRRRPVRGRGRAIWSSNEWARTADDVLWRRSRLGLHVGEDTVARLEEMLGDAAPRRTRRGGQPMSLRLDGVSRVVGDEVWIDTLSLDLAGGPALRAARADAGRQDLADAADRRSRPADHRAGCWSTAST